jgi:peptidoglycan/LPS O-acetylase OafA/YrhL
MMRERLNYLDNLRAYIMLLGIVIHVAMLQMVSQTPQRLREKDLSEWSDMLVFGIHSFRMPLFFILSGFFFAAILKRRGLFITLKSRLYRLGGPLIIFSPLVSVSLSYIILEYLTLMQVTGVFVESDWISNAQEYQFNFAHLWFLYYLFLCHLILLPFVFISSCFDSLKRAKYWAGHPLMIFVYAIIIAYLDSFYDKGMIPADGSLIPNFLQLFHYFPYFTFGFIIFRFRSVWLKHYQRCWGRYTLLGSLFMFVSLVVMEPLMSQPGEQVDNFIVAYSYGLCGWCWSFALCGFFKQCFSSYKPVFTYLSESAYWVYIIHLPFIILISYAIYDYTWPFYIKMTVNIVFTSILSITSYHLFVRYTWLGQLLNGKRKTPKWRKVSTPRCEQTS